MKISLRVAALAALFSVTGVLLSAGIPPKRAIGSFAGVVHAGAKYRVPLDGVTESSLHEGVDRISIMGSRAVKLWLSPNMYRQYLNFNGRTDYKTSGYAGALEVLQRPDYKAVLDDVNNEFDVFSLEYFPFIEGPNGTMVTINFSDGLSSTELNKVTEETRAIADYLFTTYGSKNKVFIIQNWEGDNDLGFKKVNKTTGQLIVSPNDWTARINDFKTYMQARQDAISASRADHPNATCKVYCAFEVNIVPPNDVPLVTRDGQQVPIPLLVDEAVPYVQCDLYSYSSWNSFGFPEEAAEVVSKLSYLREKAPKAGILGADNLMLGEYGAYENGWYPEDPVKRRHSAYSDDVYAKTVYNQIRYALGEGVRYAFQWSLLAGGLRDPEEFATSWTENTYPYSNPVPAPYEDLKGTWLIRPPGPSEYPAATFTTVYSNLSRLFYRSIYQDGLGNLGNTWAANTGLGITTTNQTWDEGDNTRLWRTATGEQRFAYEVANTSSERIVDWTVKAFIKGNFNPATGYPYTVGRLAFSTRGGTGSQWTTPKPFEEKVELRRSVGSGYYRFILTPPADAFPSDPDDINWPRYFRIHLLDSGPLTDTQVGSVTFYTDSRTMKTDPLQSIALNPRDPSTVVLDHSSNLAVTTSTQTWADGDTNRLFRNNSVDPGWIVYDAPIVDGFEVTVFHKGLLDGQLEVAISHDGNSDQWENVLWSATPTDMGSNVFKSVAKNTSPLPVGRSFVRIRVLGGTAGTSFMPQVGEVKLSCQSP